MNGVFFPSELNSSNISNPGLGKGVTVDNKRGHETSRLRKLFQDNPNK